MKRGPKALMIAAMGARGTGKSAWCIQQLGAAPPPRLVVWDLMGEHESWAGPAAADLASLVRAMKAPAFRVRFVPSPDPEARAAQFDLVCRACQAAGNLTFYAEELAFVTTASHAPAGWKALCLLGRHKGVTIYGTSQRPASVDKDFFGNLDVIHCGRQTSEGDAKVMAGFLGVPWRSMQQLPDLHYLHRAAGDMAAAPGVLTFGAPARPARKVARRTA